MTRRRTAPTVDPVLAASMLAGTRLAVVGASEAAGSFGGTIYRALRDHGVDVVAVHPTATTLDGDLTYPSLSAIPEPVDGAIVMVPAPASVDVVLQCAAQGIGKVWLFQGLGGAGAASDEAVAVARDLGLEVVPGACPLMFLEPVGWFHRVHRAGRRARKHLAVAPAGQG